MPKTSLQTSAGLAPDTALTGLRSALGAAGIDAERLDVAQEMAQVVVDLTQDRALALAALLQAAAPDPDTLADAVAVRAAAGAEALRLAGALRRLGEFGLDERWSEAQSLTAAQAETLRKMLLAVVGDPRLVVARLAQQLVRARHARALPASERRHVALETRDLYAPIANRLGIWGVKWELEDLAFRELQAEDYRRIAGALNEKRRDREDYITRVCAQLKDEMQRAGIRAEIQGRPKHIYSIYRKMQRKALSFEQLFDVRAVRIIVDSVSDCYAALGIVHGLWPFIPGEFDDYIATPKENDYQSIHTAVHGPDGRSLEIQIRTHAMQAQAELGVAAHWVYKEGGAQARKYEHKIQAVRELLSNPSGSHVDGPDAFSKASAGLFDDRIYAMTPKGEVVDLPRGATPLDFAFHVHSDLGQRCRGAKINGRIVTFDHQVANGDVVEILTGKNAAPSRDWLSPERGYLASPRSRAKLRAYFRRLDDAQGAGAAGATPGPAPAPEPAPVPPPPPKTRRIIGSGRSPVDIEGVGDLPITLARCCGPVRPQPIAGYLTLGRGVTIHRAGCPGLARMLKAKPERELKVEWSTGQQDLLAVKIAIEAFDRRGLLRDISDLIAEERLSIEGVSSDTDPNDRIARFEVRLGVPDNAALTRLTKRLARIPNVFKVRRAT
jgi:GTP pyrophosphokinase